MRRVALKIAYNGTNFHGYQRQPNLRTVEGEILDVFKKTGIIEDTWKAHYSVAGRTDKGVHSTGNVISFITDEEIYINKINGLLPDDIKILGQARVPYSFKVRFPLDRTYTYIQPLYPDYGDIDIDRINEAMKYFIGEHNFRNFSKRNEKNPIREIYDTNLEVKDNLLIFTVVGKSFLWNMVRKMITALLKIGMGTYEPSIIKTLLESDDIRQEIRLQPAPACGLILSDMNYKNIKFKDEGYGREKIIQSSQENIIMYEHLKQANCGLINLLKGE